eukprot:TRINITY_DN1021_c0_g2_i1.p1 TRINITY_DN1021_c0_g2~~TRINITY_DN1021_c0_g2_i1.p1  ORF type:complete len:309 (+),score=41.17 TRINITY_DN1021_c0_g2_i1:2-928(+)
MKIELFVLVLQMIFMFMITSMVCSAKKTHMATSSCVVETIGIYKDTVVCANGNEVIIFEESDGTWVKLSYTVDTSSYLSRNINKLIFNDDMIIALEGRTSEKILVVIHKKNYKWVIDGSIKDERPVTKSENDDWFAYEGYVSKDLIIVSGSFWVQEGSWKRYPGMHAYRKQDGIWVEVATVHGKSTADFVSCSYSKETNMVVMSYPEYYSGSRYYAIIEWYEFQNNKFRFLRRTQNTLYYYYCYTHRYPQIKISPNGKYIIQSEPSATVINNGDGQVDVYSYSCVGCDEQHSCGFNGTCNSDTNLCEC